MPCCIRMKTIYLRGLLWLYLLGFGYNMVLSLEPGYLDFDNLPDTNFSCVGKVIGGYYADLETNCQMFHVCTIGQLDEPMDIRFLCLNGTVFDQETRVCERIDEVDCSKSEQFYSLNLELYGNTQPPIVEDNPETDPPIIIKATTTTTTTTTTQRPKPKTTRTQFYTTPTPTITTVTNAKVISTHHFPITGQSDIRFNPEEINISLIPRAPPNVRTKSVAFQQQIFTTSDGPNHNNNKKAVVTTSTSYSDDKNHFVQVLTNPNTQRPLLSSSTQKSSYGLTHDKTQPPATPADINYGFTYHQTENTNQEYHTELPRHNYQYQTNVANFRPEQYRTQYKTTTYRTEHIPTTRKHHYLSSLKPPTYHHDYGTEKPQRLQLPLPLLPTLPPLTFSSPAPFSLSRHDTKRYTNDHQPPPRIIISASASVSDASGRRLNYSLGTIGVTPLLEESSRSYDDYKDHDVILDPFYDDVPKIKNRRRKRQVQQVKHSEVIKNEQEAVDVLKFLFDWYKDQEKSSTTPLTGPIPPQIISEINDELSPVETPLDDKNETKEVEPLDVVEDNNFDFRDSALFKRKSKFNIVGDVLSVTEKEEGFLTTTPAPSDIQQGSDDYVDDNYEALIHQENTTENDEIVTTVTKEEEDLVETTTELTTTSTTPTTTTTTTTTTTIKPPTSHLRRRGRGRFHTHENRKDLHSYYDHSKLRKEIIPYKSASRRRNRGRFTTESLKLESSSIVPTEEMKQTETGNEDHSKMAIEKLEHFSQSETKVENESIATTAIYNIETSTIILHNEEEEKETESITSTTTEVLSSTFNEEKEESKDDVTTSYNNEISSLAPLENEKEETEVTNEDNLSTPLSVDEEITAFETDEKVEETTMLKEIAEIPKNEEEVETTISKPRNRGRNRFKVQTEREKDEEFLQLASTESPKHENVESEVTTITEKVDEDKNENNEEKYEDKENIHENTEARREDKENEDAVRDESKKEKHEDKEEYVNTEEKVNDTENKEEKHENKEDNYEDKEDKYEYEEYENETDLKNYEDANSEPKPTDSRVTEFAETDTTLTTPPSPTTSTTPITTETKHFDYSTTQMETTTEDIQVTVETTTSNQSDFNKESSPSDEEIRETTLENRVDSTTEHIINITNENNAESSTLYLSSTYQTGTTEIISEPSSEIPSTMLTPAETTTRPSSIRRRTRPSYSRHPYSVRRPNPRHRFSTDLYTPRPTRRKSIIEDEIIDILTSQLTTTESLKRIDESRDPTSTKIPDYTEDIPTTDAPLFKSANPTQAERVKESLHTTPISRVYKTHVRKEKIKSFIFNCFGKPINKFYSDPRDCRLFHYCTSGYTKNQLLDMKFVCDLGTYFDDKKLICTKVKPERCL